MTCSKLTCAPAEREMIMNYEYELNKYQCQFYQSKQIILYELKPSTTKYTWRSRQDLTQIPEAFPNIP